MTLKSWFTKTWWGPVDADLVDLVFAIAELHDTVHIPPG
jgi:hypothetical protein